MKKLFTLIIFGIFIIVTPVDAAIIKYNEAGGVVSVTQGPYTNRNVNNFGSNALFSPSTIQKNSIENERRYLRRKFVENTKNINVNVNTNGLPMNRYYDNGAFNRYYGNHGVYQTGPTRTRYYYNNGGQILVPGVRFY